MDENQKKELEELEAQLKEHGFKILMPVGIWTYVMYAVGILFVIGGIYNLTRGIQVSNCLITMALGLGAAAWPWYNVWKNGTYGNRAGVPMKRKKK